MRKVVFIFIAVVIQSVSVLWAQTEEARLLDYLVNPTQQERTMFQNLHLSQINEAIAMYDSNSLIDQLRSLTEEISDLHSDLSNVKNRRVENRPAMDSLRSMIINQIQLLRMTGEQKNIDRVLKMVKKLITDYPADITFMKPYLDVMFQIGDWEECDRVLDLFEKHCTNEYDLARIYQNRGSVANGRTQIQEAISYYNKALEIYNKYAEKYGYDYEGVATKMLTTYNILMQIYYKLQEKDVCLDYMDKVLAIGEIAVKYDDIDAPLVYASSCNGMAQKLNSYGETARADSLYKIVFDYLEVAYTNSPFRSGSTYAFYHMNKSRDFLANEKIDEAAEYADIALEAMARLYRVFPKWSAVNYFESLRLRAEIYTIQDKYEEAKNMFEDARGELDEIEMDSPGSNQMRYYFLYYDIAANEASIDNYTEAISYFEKAKTMIVNLDPRLRDRSTAICDKYIEMCREAMAKEASESTTQNDKEIPSEDLPESV